MRDKDNIMTRIPRLLEGWTVLIVDDEVDSLEVARRLITMAGAQTLTADSGRSALELLKHTSPHFILSDLSMPDMDGWELAHLLKRDRRTLEIPVIALTAHAMSGDRDRAIAAGFHNHIAKPLDPLKFVGQLLNILVDVPNLADMIINVDERR